MKAKFKVGDNVKIVRGKILYGKTGVVVTAWEPKNGIKRWTYGVLLDGKVDPNDAISCGESELEIIQTQPLFQIGDKVRVKWALFRSGMEGTVTATDNPAPGVHLYAVAIEGQGEQGFIEAQLEKVGDEGGSKV